MPEVYITMSFGEIRFSYATPEELNEQLKAIESQVPLIEATAVKVRPRPRRPPKPGYGEVYGFTSDGLVELYKWPPAQVQIVALALYAYSPYLVSVNELSRVTGIETVYSSVLAQKKNKQYFRREGDLYGLRPPGVKMVQELRLGTPAPALAEPGIEPIVETDQPKGD